MAIDALGTSPDALARELSRVAPDVVEWRRHLHAHPELSFHEVQTSAYLAARLDDLGLEVRRPTPTSVVGVLRGARGGGHTVAVRADIDALPIHEETGLPFASTNPGVMHACGHDGHAAVVLGVATVLTRLRDLVAGEVRFVFQHAEEQMPKGAPQLIDAGVLDGVDAIVGQHFFAALPTGTVGFNDGALMASSDAFEITFTGRGGHGGLPHEAVDPVPATADLIHAVQRLVAKEFDPQDPVVATITTLRAGEVYNVIPEQATVGGTARALSPGARDRLERRLDEISHGVAALHGLTAEVAFEHGPPVVINHAEIVAAVREAASASAHVQVTTDVAPVMGGDDYAFYLERVPGAYVVVGAGGSAGGRRYPHHHPKFDLDESALGIATELLTRSALSLLDTIPAPADPHRLARCRATPRTTPGPPAPRSRPSSTGTRRSSGGLPR